MSTTLQILLALLATIAAVASAVAAWKASVTAQSELAFQKTLARSQGDFFLMRLTLANLRRLKRLLSAPLAASDDDFSSIERMYLEIKKDLEHISEIVPASTRNPSFFDAPSFSKARISQITSSTQEIELEVKRIETKINEMIG